MPDREEEFGEPKIWLGFAYNFRNKKSTEKFLADWKLFIKKSLGEKQHFVLHNYSSDHINGQKMHSLTGIASK